MLKQRISQKLLQKLSPQQIQLMKLLQVPTASLEQRVQDELEANPALEEGREEAVQEQEPEKEYEDNDIQEEVGKEEEIDLSEYMDDDEPSYKYSSGTYGGDEEEKTMPIPVVNSFHEHLLQQLSTIQLDSEKEELIARQIIGSIDEDGYLRRDISAMINDLAFAQNIEADEEEIIEVLKKIQKFDPPGVGARDLRECLLIQLERKDKEDKNILVAEEIIKDHFEAFTKKHYQRLQKQLDTTEEELKAAIDEILKLNPKPGSGYSENIKTHHYVIPDFTLRNNNGELELELNSMNAPELKISKDFKEMLKSYKAGKKDQEQKQAVMFIKQKLDAAQWFIDAIRQRQMTLLSVMHAIMEYQYDFLLTGDETKLRPMILKDIAKKTELDISTVSRVANSKYVQTEFGVLALKYFFSESLQTESGEEVSTKEVKNILQQLIDNESKRKPLSDQRLMELLKEKGYNIARRTVAKYREQLNIPVARLRKEL